MSLKCLVTFVCLFYPLNFSVGIQKIFALFHTEEVLLGSTCEGHCVRFDIVWLVIS